MKIKRLWAKALYVFLIVILMFCVSASTYFIPQVILAMFALTFFWWIAALILVLIYPRGAALWSNSKVIKGAMGAIVLVPCWAALNIIRNGSDGVYTLLFVFFLIWGADTTAYFTGKKWGVTKLAPLVSPGKSLQGVAGALVYTILFTLLIVLFVRPPAIIVVSVLMLAVVTVLFSILGDLFESMLKREAGLKDSSHILPGHGGLLDRIDSLTAAAPIYVFGTLVLSILYS